MTIIETCTTFHYIVHLNQYSVNDRQEPTTCIEVQVPDEQKEHIVGVNID